MTICQFFIPCYGGGCPNESVDEAGNYPNVVLVAMTLDILVVAKGGGVYTDHIIGVLVWTFHLIIYRGIIATSGVKNDLIFKVDMHEVVRVVKISSFVFVGCGSVVAMVMVDFDDFFDELVRGGSLDLFW